MTNECYLHVIEVTDDQLRCLNFRSQQNVLNCVQYFSTLSSDNSGRPSNNQTSTMNAQFYALHIHSFYFIKQWSAHTLNLQILLGVHMQTRRYQRDRKSPEKSHKMINYQINDTETDNFI